MRKIITSLVAFIFNIEVNPNIITTAQNPTVIIFIYNPPIYIY